MKFDGKERPLGREMHYDHVVGMAAPQVEQLDGLATELDGHPVREGDVRNRSRSLLADDGALGVLVGHDDGGIGERFPP